MQQLPSKVESWIASNAELTAVMKVVSLVESKADATAARNDAMKADAKAE